MKVAGGVHGSGPVVLFAALLVGCPEEEEEAAGEPDPAAGGAERASAAPEPSKASGHAPPDRSAIPSARLVVRADGGRRRVTVAPGERLPAPGTGRPVAVDLGRSGRVTLGPGAHARLGAVAPAQVLLARGWARLERAPSGGGQQAALRLATPAATVAVPRSGEAWVAALSDGRTWVAVTSGRIALETGAAGEGGQLVRVPVEAGKATLVAGEPGEPAPGPGDADEARERVASLLEEAEPRPVQEDQEALEEALSAFDGAIGELGDEDARGRALSEAHRRALPEDTGRASELRKALVGHSKALLRLHRRLLPLWERAAARAEVRAMRGEADPPKLLGDRTERVRAAIAGQP